MKSLLIVGLGSIGRRHARVFRAAGIEDIAGADLRQDRLDQARNEVGITELDTDYRALLARRKFDAVLVTLPTAFHTPVMRAAVSAGCHLFVEKPVAHESTGLDAIVKEADAKGLVAYTAYCYRFAPSTEKMKQIVDSGALGRVLSARLIAVAGEERGGARLHPRCA